MSRRTEVVQQRQFGIICPEQDLNRVRRMGTGALTACFGYILRDLQKGIDLLAHLDYSELLPQTLDLALPILEVLGAERLVVKAVNVQHSPDINDEALAPLPDHKRRFIDASVDRLVRMGLVLNTGWEDLGTHRSAVVETGRDVELGEFNTVDFDLSSVQLAKATMYHGLLKKVVFSEKPAEGVWLRKMMPAYIPLNRNVKVRS